MKKGLWCVLFCGWSVVVVACGGGDEEAAVEAEIAIEPQGPVHLDVGEVLELEVSVEGADEEGLRWENERRAVASFDGEHTVEALREGYTRLIAGHEEDDAAQAILEIFVEDRCEEGLCIRPREVALHPGAEQIFELRGTGGGEVDWSAEEGEFVDDGLYVAPDVDVWDRDEPFIDVVRAELDGVEEEVEVSVQFWVPIPNGERDPEARIQQMVEHPQERRLYIPTSEGIFRFSEVTRAWERIRDTRGGLPQPRVSSLEVDSEGALLAEVRDIYRRPVGSESFENLGIGNHPYGLATLGTTVFGAKRGDDDYVYRYEGGGEWEPFASIGHRTRSMRRVGDHIYVNNHGSELMRFDAQGQLEGMGEAGSVTKGPEGEIYTEMDRRLYRFEGGQWEDAGLAELPEGERFLHWDGEYWYFKRISQVYRLEGDEWEEYGPPVRGPDGSPSRRLSGPEGRMYVAMSGRNPLDSNEELYFDVVMSPAHFFGDEEEAPEASEVAIDPPPYAVLQVGTELPLGVEVQWSDGRRDEAAMWVSSDTRVATVDRRGRVKAKAPGEVVIRARARGDLEVYDELVIEVVDEEAEPVELHIDPAQVSIFEGESAQLEAQIEWRRIYDSAYFSGAPAVHWEIADPAVATVDSEGYLEAQAPGETEVQAHLEGWPEVEAVAPVEIQALGGE